MFLICFLGIFVENRLWVAVKKQVNLFFSARLFVFLQKQIISVIFLCA